MVPEEATAEMKPRAAFAVSAASGKPFGALVDACHAALIEQSPGNALLSEILAARDYVTANTDPAKRCNDLRLILDALAKLGPAL